jgi:hypothetical protein
LDIQSHPLILTASGNLDEGIEKNDSEILFSAAEAKNVDRFKFKISSVMSICYCKGSHTERLTELTSKAYFRVRKKRDAETSSALHSVNF